MKPHIALLLIAIIQLMSACVLTAAPLTTIDFGVAGDSMPLPYSEDGLTFEDLGSGQTTVRIFNSVLSAGPNSSFPVRIRASSEQPFDLVSMNFGYLFHSLRIESSAGGVLALYQSTPSNHGIVAFNEIAGFKNITHFDLVQDLIGDREVSARAAMRVDDINLIFIPEPSGLIWLWPILVWVWYRKWPSVSST